MTDLSDKCDKLEKHFGLMNKDTNSEEYFASVVKIAVEEYGLKIDEFSYEFEVAPSTIQRWIENKSRPAPQIRELVIKYILGRI